MKTIFITGASSGIGRETALLFNKKGWHVIATMRHPEKEKTLETLKNITLLPCDVTKESSIKLAIKKGVEKLGKIDVLVNNAGYYSVGILESATSIEIDRQIQTNLIGTIKTTKEIIPLFSKQKAGVIINISSIAGIISAPLQTLYHATKWGIEGFSESLQYELRNLNIRVKIIEPGIIKTDFWGRSMTLNQNTAITTYGDYEKRVLSNLIEDVMQGSHPKETAETIFKAASDGRKKLRYPTGKSSILIYVRKLLPYRLYCYLTQKIMEK